MRGFVAIALKVNSDWALWSVRDPPANDLVS